MDEHVQNHITPGESSAPKIKLFTPGGASAEIYLHGAQLTSWIPASGSEWLFLSQASNFGADSSIRGGIPVIFPQFSDLGSLPKHGFVRRMDWEPYSLKQDRNSCEVVMQLKTSPSIEKIWPHRFKCDLIVHLSDLSIAVTLSVKNEDVKDFSFTAALHTYLRVGDISATRINGLKGCKFIDSAHGKSHCVDEQDPLTFTDEIDRIYLSVPPQLSLEDGQRRLQIEMDGFKDVVIWNPWIEKGAALSDLEPDGYRNFACIEAAAVEKPITLSASESWSGSQIFYAK